MLPAAKLPRREGMKAVEKLCRSSSPTAAAAANTSTAHALGTASGGDTARRHQSLLADEDEANDTANSATTNAENSRGGPTLLKHLQLRVVAKTDHFLVLNKREDHRLDGAFDATIEKALHRDYPEIEKFRWIHQLDFATSGVMCIGLEKAATAMACKLFREKRVQKEYLAVVRGHLPYHPRDLLHTEQQRRVRACTFSKLDLLIQDTEDFDKLTVQLKGTPAHQRHPQYPRGIRHAPALFQMEKNKLSKEKAHGAGGGRLLTEQEEKIISSKWAELSKEDQQKFEQLYKQDRARYEAEIVHFLDSQREQLASKRQYDVCDRDEPNEPNEPDDEPVAYVFDDPIAEPDRDSFRMQIGHRHGDDSKPSGKASSTIAFVLGHAVFENEPVTKVLLRPLTGRRHQLRLHLSHNGFPILGDATYASANETAPRMMLHAWRLWLMADAKAQQAYGELYFETADPFEAIVPSERKTLTTMTYGHKTPTAKAPSVE